MTTIEESSTSLLSQVLSKTVDAVQRHPSFDDSRTTKLRTLIDTSEVLTSTAVVRLLKEEVASSDENSRA